MTKQEANSLPPALYRVYWKSGGTSYAAVGIRDNGSRWLAPCNWIVPTVEPGWWRMVERIELLVSR
ncbi:MAG TPA: hypothetical protein VFM18_18825 [Methanosarcina sp.]|nr:hypothetical protein [Methanosarcina sp.]